MLKGLILFILIVHSSASVKHYYEQYFDQSRKALREGEDQNLCLLFIQCFEVLFFNVYSAVVIMNILLLHTACYLLSSIFRMIFIRSGLESYCLSQTY